MAMTRTIKILAAGFYGAGNVGDELLLRQMAGWAQEAGASLGVVSVDAGLSVRLHGLPTVSHADLPEVARAVASYDLVLLGGGGLFQDHDRFAVEDLYAYPGAGVSYYAQPCLIARQMGKPYLPLAMGLGPLRSPASRLPVADLFRGAAAISVRDARSAELLRGLIDRPFAVAPDPVWARERCGERARVAERFPALAGKKVLAMLVRAWPYCEGWEERLVAGVRAALAEGWGLLWVPFQAPDLPALERMMAAVGEGAAQALWREPKLEELEPVLAGCQAAFAMRLHGLILAARAGLPLISYSYDDKVSSAADGLGLASQARLTTEDPPERIADSLRWLLAQGQPPDAERVRGLGEAALEHRRLLHEAIAACSAKPEAPGWNAGGFDWLCAWTIARGAADASEKSRMRASLENERQAKAKALAELHASAEQAADLRSRSDAASSALAEATRCAASLASSLEGARAERDRLTEERAQLRQELERTRQDRESLREELARIKASRGWRSLETLRAVRQAARDAAPWRGKK
jgi:polysaccharide pyruvyl transferase CsaB